MKSYRNVTVFNDELRSMLDYLKKSNENPTIIISSLNIPKVKRNNLLDKMKYFKFIEDLEMLYNLCNYFTHIYIFSEIENLSRDLQEMENAGFKLRNILSYKIGWKYNKEEKLYFNNLKYVLFFTIDDIKVRDRKLNIRRQTNLLFDKVIRTNNKDYPKEIIDKLIKNSLMKSLDENIIIDLNSTTGNVAEYCLKNNLKCYSFGKDNIIHLRLTKLLNQLDNYKKKKEVINIDKKQLMKDEINKLFKK